MKYKLSVLFFLWKYKTNRRGTAPLMCRVTLGGKRAQFSTGLSLSPKEWHTKAQRVTGTSSYHSSINLKLQEIRHQLLSRYLELDLDRPDVTLVIKPFKRQKYQPNTLIALFDEYIVRIEKLVHKDFHPSTIQKHRLVKSNLIDLLKHLKKGSDIGLAELNFKFLDDFKYYMRAELKLAIPTVNKRIKVLKKVATYAVSREYLVKNPFTGYRLKSEQKSITYLIWEELQSIEKWEPPTKKLENVWDCFVFSCFTGLDYSSSKALRQEHIKSSVGGLNWIKMIRIKTGKTIEIPVLPQAQKILDKYQGCDPILPLMSNQKFNEYVKDIGKDLGISTKLTHHLARRTFATTVLLSRGVPIEVVKELLTHSNVTTTEKSYISVSPGIILRHLNELFIFQ